MNQPIITQSREYEPVRYENEREVSREPVHVEEERAPRKRSILVLISAVIGTLYAIYLINYFSGLGSTAASDTEAVGFGIATILVMPHMALTALAVIFNWLGFFTKVRGLVLTGAILYCVAAFVFFMYAIFVVPEIILSFIGFVRMKKR